MKSTYKRNENDQDVLDKQQQVLDIRKKYKNDFSKLIGADRTNKLFEAEMKFREMVKRNFKTDRKRKINTV